MSFLRNIIRSFYRPRYFIGTDLEGNRFFEHPSLTSDPARTRRRVEYKVYDDMWDYIGGARRLPVQWTSWLSHTRPDPPTLDELHSDLERQRRVLHNAAVIAARDQEERGRISAAHAHVEIPEPTFTSPQITSAVENGGFVEHTAHEVAPAPMASQNADNPSPGVLPSHSAELPSFGRDKDWQPETWSPQAARRRGL
ncbi:hypothetical protein BC834DRAFT_459221 [Gloeopeniophorella convolvens]|nr:hypothetical protein BC834DRAFT_459221 [Gloeopeniophorella convolvens]